MHFKYKYCYFITFKHLAQYLNSNCDSTNCHINVKLFVDKKAVFVPAFILANKRGANAIAMNTKVPFGI